MLNEFNIQSLKNLIEQETQLKDILKQKKEQFEKENEELLTRIKETSSGIDDLKVAIKIEAIEQFKQNPSVKKLLGGIGIRVGTEFIYDSNEAFKWAMDHKLCLSLDTKAFESLCKSNALEFVTMKDKITVTFPSKLV